MFEFGENWTQFLSVVNDERIEIATQSLRRLTGVDQMQGLRFLDIGSGSGLFSLAARRLGAEVVSFDYDKASVACTEEMKRRYASGDPRWRIEHGSVLDADFMRSLGQFDIVYSWGVLHHTGAMWKAIEEAAGAVRPGGRFCIAIYNRQRRMTPIWTLIKRTYQKVPKPLRTAYVLAVMVPRELRGAVRHPVIYTRAWIGQLERQRGMSRWYDMIDWVGGYPFETSTPHEVVNFCARRGFLLYALNGKGHGIGCNEFAFIRSTPAA